MYATFPTATAFPLQASLRLIFVYLSVCFLFVINYIVLLHTARRAIAAAPNGGGTLPDFPFSRSSLTVLLGLV